MLNVDKLGDYHDISNGNKQKRSEPASICGNDAGELLIDLT